MSLIAVCLGMDVCAGLQAREIIPEAAPSTAKTATQGIGFSPTISARDFAAHVKILASDEFGGRAPGTAGEEKTLQYLVAQFQRMGLAPGNGESYFQTVTVMTSSTDVRRSSMQIVLPEKHQELLFGTQMLIATRTGKSETVLQDSPMVFVGFGINAPGQNWNDYADIDIKGKTVVMLSGAPDFHMAAATPYENHRLNFYARPNYKFEEAARQGAAAALIIHDKRGTGYDWYALQKRWSKAQFDLPADGAESRLPVQGWINGDVAPSLFASAGLDFSRLRAAAGQRDFKPVVLTDAKLDIALASRIVIGESRNVIAKLVGSKYPNEAIIYSAHWDHLGTHPNEPGNNIYHGAIDNASGVAGVLEIAAQFATQNPKPERSIVFLIPTFEEEGLIGSKFYTRHPSIPLQDIVADINFDVLVPIGPARDFVVVGLGYSTLDAIVKPLVAAQGRVIAAEDVSQADSFYRSDHLSFALAGVPVLYMAGGTRSQGMSLRSQDFAQSTRSDYGNHRYHTPADKFDPHWDLRGIVQDLQVSYAVGATLANSREWPKYQAGTVYRSISDSLHAASAH
ncbi:M28 family peptidase [Pseudolysobacter antarcticus]|nr:M28 family peptidase [Pseudolysobacter antarcticus]